MIKSIEQWHETHSNVNEMGPAIWDDSEMRGICRLLLCMVAEKTQKCVRVQIRLVKKSKTYGQVKLATILLDELSLFGELKVKYSSHFSHFSRSLGVLASFHERLQIGLFLRTKNFFFFTFIMLFSTHFSLALFDFFCTFKNPKFYTFPNR